jgi:hypothetical protein
MAGHRIVRLRLVAIGVACASMLVHAATAAGQTAGGRNLRISVAGPTVILDWDDGDVETGYLIVRISLLTGSTTVLPNPQQPGQQRYEDVPPGGFGYCYIVIPLDGDTVLGTSDMLCASTGLAAGSFMPRQFSLSLNQSTTATLTWMRPAESFSLYILYTAQLDGSGESYVPLPAFFESAPRNAPVPVCFTLFAARTSENYSNTELLCGFPGASTLAARPPR